MRHLSVTLVSALLCASVSSALAQVEPRFAGDWEFEPESGGANRTLHVDGAGRYRTVSNGQIIGNGTITLNDGVWKLKSDSGSQEEGRFSVVGGKIKLYGGSLAGRWAKSAGGSAPPPQPRSTYYAARPATPSIGSPSTSSSQSHTSIPVKLPSSSPSLGHGSPVSEAVNGMPAFAPSRSAVPYPGPTPQADVRNFPGNGPALTRQHPGYNIPGAVPQSGLPGYEPSAMTGTKNGTSATVSEGATRSSGYQYPAAQRSIDFETWSKAQQQYAGMRGPRPVPQGGYIPVMKDGKARRFFRGY